MISTDADNLTLPPTRQSGVCLHLTSLPGHYGIGEIGTNALEFIDTLASMSLKVWQFLPTGPTAYGDSPYQSLSTFAGNELLIDIELLTRSGLLKRADIQPLLALPHSTVDYGALIPIKTTLLRAAANNFARNASAALKADYDQFLERNNARWLHDYALYRVLKTQHQQRPWPEWEQRFVRREPAALRQLEQIARQQLESIKIMQFLFHQQWSKLRSYARDKRILLFGDIPIYVALDSADAWANPELLCMNAERQADAVAGVPPDYFSADGQLWGNPLYDWNYHADTGYAWWIQRLRHASLLADMVRVDHFRAFEAYWTVPAQSDTARNGHWQGGPGNAFFDAVREALGNVAIVAEDLGVITPEVEALRDRYQIPGMRVLQFDAANRDLNVGLYRENSICYTGTHDNDTTAGWFRGSPNDLRSSEDIERTREAVLHLTRGSSKTIHNDMINLAFSSNARLAMAPMQDYLGLGSEARLNTPGTTFDNWRWRLRAQQISPQLCESVSTMISTNHRGDTGQSST